MARRYSGRKYWIHKTTGIIYAVEFKDGEMVAARVIDRPSPTRNYLRDLELYPGWVNHVQSRSLGCTTYNVHSGQGTEYEEKENPAPDVNN